MKLHLYFFPHTLHKSRSANSARRCVYYILRIFVDLLGGLSTMPRQNNKRGDLRPDSSYVPALYRGTLVRRDLIVC